MPHKAIVVTAGLPDVAGVDVDHGHHPELIEHS